MKIAEDELKQILLNILNNAIDAVWESPQKEIAIRAAVRSERVVIEFEDSGPRSPTKPAPSIRSIPPSRLEKERASD